MTDFQAALGLSQLTKLDKFLIKRNRLAKEYMKNLRNLPLKTQKIEKSDYSSYHLFVVNLNLKKIDKSYKQIYLFLNKYKIAVNKHYPCVHLQPFYRSLGFRPKMYPNSENYEKCALSLPISTKMNFSDVRLVSKILKKAITK